MKIFVFFVQFQCKAMSSKLRAW